MAKDPAFLFYPGDWLGGTITFSRSHKGAYMDLLMAQHSVGHMTEEEIKEVLGEDYEKMWESKLKKKFEKDSEGKYFNAKLEFEIFRRRRYKESRKENLKKKSHTIPHMDSHKVSHMENGNGNGNIIGIENEEKGGPGGVIRIKPELNNYLDIWKQVYKRVRGSAYVNNEGDADLERMEVILRLYEQKYKKPTEFDIRLFFDRVLNIDDKWWKANLTPKLLAKKFNEACGMVEYKNSKEDKILTYTEVCNMVTGQGYKMGDFKKIEQNKWVKI